LALLAAAAAAEVWDAQTMLSTEILMAIYMFLSMKIHEEMLVVMAVPIHWTNKTTTKEPKQMSVPLSGS
jgi:hypothetical protein